MTGPATSARRRPRARRARAADRDRGSSASLELLILTPVVVVLLLLVVALGRYAHGRQLVEQAAAAAARAASLAPGAAQAGQRGGQAATGSLTDAGLSCTGLSTVVDTGDFRPGGTVAVHLVCTADLSDLVGVGVPGQVQLEATGAAVLETYRHLETGQAGQPQGAQVRS